VPHVVPQVELVLAAGSIGRAAHRRHLSVPLSFVRESTIAAPLSARLVASSDPLFFSFFLLVYIFFF
jgi:hypothetical protein